MEVWIAPVLGVVGVLVGAAITYVGSSRALRAATERSSAELAWAREQFVAEKQRASSESMVSAFTAHSEEDQTLTDRAIEECWRLDRDLGVLQLLGDREDFRLATGESDIGPPRMLAPIFDGGVFGKLPTELGASLVFVSAHAERLVAAREAGLPPDTLWRIASEIGAEARNARRSIDQALTGLLQQQDRLRLERRDWRTTRAAGE